jgi:hypothetical protein
MWIDTRPIKILFILLFAISLGGCSGRLSLLKRKYMSGHSSFIHKTTCAKHRITLKLHSSERSEMKDGNIPVCNPNTNYHQEILSVAVDKRGIKKKWCIKPNGADVQTYSDNLRLRIKDLVTLHKSLTATDKKQKEDSKLNRTKPVIVRAILFSIGFALAFFGGGIFLLSTDGFVGPGPKTPSIVGLILGFLIVLLGCYLAYLAVKR